MMKKHAWPLSFICFLSAALTLMTAWGQAYQLGQTIESFTTKDQHDVAFTFEAPSTKYLLISHDMETGRQANAALNALGSNYLGAKKAVFMANIHGMPAIGRFFAMPKMRKYAHRIIIADDKALIERFPKQTGKVTVLSLNRGKVEKISYWGPASENISNYLK